MLLMSPYLLNHVMRSWLFAAKIGHIKSIDYDHEVVAVGTILKDIGLTAGVSGSNRFEVDGADAALVKERGLSMKLRLEVLMHLFRPKRGDKSDDRIMAGP